MEFSIVNITPTDNVTFASSNLHVNSGEVVSEYRDSVKGETKKSSFFLGQFDFASIEHNFYLFCCIWRVLEVMVMEGFWFSLVFLL